MKTIWREINDQENNTTELLFENPKDIKEKYGFDASDINEDPSQLWNETGDLA